MGVARSGSWAPDWSQLLARGSVHMTFDVPASLSKCKNVVLPQGGHILWRSHILRTKPYDQTQCTRQSHTLMSDTNSLQSQAQPVLWNANLPQMISHFLGFSQTLILKRGHKGGTFSKILRNSHWISPESGFSPQDALTPVSLKLWGKSMFATQEGGRGFFHTWGIQVYAKLCSLRRFIT